MDGVLSQEEINALLNDPVQVQSNSNQDTLSDSEKDMLGEIANISMGNSATTLSSLVNRKVEISTPVISFATWDDIVKNYERPCVFIRIAYTEGLNGSNILVLKEKDVKIITDLMMGGDGTNTDGDIGELHLSAISEAMNQMMGSAATSLSSLLDKKIDISPPISDVVDLQENIDETVIDKFLAGKFVKISFRMEIGDLVDSDIMQLYPISFAKEMCLGVAEKMNVDVFDRNSNSEAIQSNSNIGVQSTSNSLGEMQQTMNQSMMNQQQFMNQQQMMEQQMMEQQMMGQQMMGQQMMGQPMMGQQFMNQQQAMGQQMYAQQPVNVQPAQFQAFNNQAVVNFQPENIGLIRDVPLEVSVELGRTHKSISEILDFAPGKIVELNKIAGEPIDVLVNGKRVAKGEVVVIEENFGVRITEIIDATQK